MLSRAVLFDLDGTLTDPKPGITRCIQYALSELGHAPPNADELHWCIGPPLKGSFSQLLKTSDDRAIEQALSLYRRRYSAIGLFENSLYPEIIATLKTIRSAGYKTFVATSKPHIYAARILEHFDILSLFDGVYGSEFDGTRSDKGELIFHILLTENICPASTIMVGDRKYDILGAKRHNVYTIGVTYGYGTEQELRSHCADLIADSPDEIPEFLEKICY
ncbi:MAG: HAD family hydrolase [Oscillatoriaceae cyanobacterium Prado104]|jgi:phosphoglycolate phosphatase|nr:HAD family hydrolase [Oscillatoriaceae cyanobacterium Prado104]